MIKKLNGLDPPKRYQGEKVFFKNFKPIFFDTEKYENELKQSRNRTFNKIGTEFKEFD